MRYKNQKHKIRTGVWGEAGWITIFQPIQFIHTCTHRGAQWHTCRLSHWLVYVSTISVTRTTWCCWLPLWVRSDCLYRQVCESYANKHSLVYNCIECELIIFKAGNKCPKVVPSVTLNGTALRRIAQFKLPMTLGMMQTWRGSTKRCP